MPKDAYEHENLLLNTEYKIIGSSGTPNYFSIPTELTKVITNNELSLTQTAEATARKQCIQTILRNSSGINIASSAEIFIPSSTNLYTQSSYYVRCTDSNGSFTDIAQVMLNTIERDKWVLVKASGITRLGSEKLSASLAFDMKVLGTIKIRKQKLELGTVSTEYTPTPSEWLSDPINYTWTPIQSYDNVNASERIVYRSENGINFEPIARFTGESYIDYAVKSGTLYEYFIRAHNLGFSDSDKLTMEVKYKGVIISNVNTPDDYIQAYQSDSDWYNTFKTTPTNEAELVTYEGREYPVKEAGIHREYKINTSFYLNNRDTKRLRDMHKANGIYLFRSAEECFCCEIEINDENTFMNRGKKVEVTLTKLDYNMGVRFDV
ncbi:MAG TPA: hypothetical protein DC053_23330 [Lachnoclostridium sp.]|nr:hypothetical protein [Lachnoclostridium sp.]